ncbi:hypothetical protein ACJ6WF_27375 [Streptomyces sp. MMS24-I2-30]|uniref:hypothetical protein n=1 Tax=Streptomyces sp. MMS24-I2-30 TaxID=3351564 RepID=UPI003896AE0B
MTDFLSTNVAELSSQQRAVLEETDDWRFLAAVSPVSSRGSDERLHRAWDKAVRAGKNGENFDWNDVNHRASQYAARRSGDKLDNAQLLQKVYKQGYDFGRFSRDYASVEDALQSRLTFVHQVAAVEMQSDSFAYGQVVPQYAEIDPLISQYARSGLPSTVARADAPPSRQPPAHSSRRTDPNRQSRRGR